MSSVKPCVLIPTYHHTDVLDRIVSRLRAQGLPVIIIDDGNEAEDARRIAAICAAHDKVELLRRAENGGKGAAVMDGLVHAEARGYTHALQIDADGQHDLAAVGELLRLARAHPGALITGEAVYDQSVPRSRRLARWITHIWVAINTMSFRIMDSMCGFRVYPVEATLEVARSARIAQRMAFDT
ncbi:MAG: glycosyltransferase family 2 protein, partial [Parvibaculum sp.]